MYHRYVYTSTACAPHVHVRRMCAASQAPQGLLTLPLSLPLPLPLPLLLSLILTLVRCARVLHALRRKVHQLQRGPSRGTLALLAALFQYLPRLGSRLRTRDQQLPRLGLQGRDPSPHRPKVRMGGQPPVPGAGARAGCRCPLSLGTVHTLHSY